MLSGGGVLPLCSWLSVSERRLEERTFGSAAV